MKNKPTSELIHELLNMQPKQLNEFLHNNKKYLADEKRAFYYYVKDVVDEKGIKLKDLYISAGVNEGYAGKIVRMEKHTKNRDFIIRLCLGGHFTWEETQRALKLYGMTELYPKNARDTAIIVAINNRIYDVYEVDAMLQEQGFSKLSSEI